MPHSTPQPSALKVCSKCGESKPLTEFYTHKSGREAGKPTAYCKACYRARSRTYYDANREARISYQAAHRDANREKHALYSAAWYAANSEKHAATVAAYQAANPDKRASHHAVNNAVQSGNLPPAWSMVCSVCDEAQAAHWHHHKGYEKQHWLDVVPVCRLCHEQEHHQ